MSSPDECLEMNPMVVRCILVCHRKVLDFTQSFLNIDKLPAARKAAGGCGASTQGYSMMILVFAHDVSSKNA